MVEPYLNLKGMASEAMDFYEGIFDGQDKTVIMLGDMPANAKLPNELKARVAYGRMKIHGTTFNFSDMEFEGQADTSAVSIRIKFDSEEETRKAYRMLVEGGRAMMELAPATDARLFGWVKDKYGIDWQIMCE